MNSLKKLPQNVLNFIQHRSTRSQNSRFVKKLHLLLSYSNSSSEIEEEFGVKWVDDEEFRINKKKVCEVLDLKLNSLNVNLKKLQFIQTQADKHGWTQWKRYGFNRKDAILLIEDQSPEIETEQFLNSNSETNLSNDLNLNQNSNFEIPFNIGILSEDRIQLFNNYIILLWQEIVESHSIQNVSFSFFMTKEAKRLQLPNQSFDNSYSIISSILSPNDISTIKFIDFYKFMAMFGPENTSMNKISSLLDSSYFSGKWLYFGYQIEEIQKYTNLFALFDENEPNCLLFHTPEKIYRVYNLPDIDSNQNYIIDENGIIYKDWISYFSIHEILLKNDLNNL